MLFEKIINFTILKKFSRKLKLIEVLLDLNELLIKIMSNTFIDLVSI